MLTNFELAAGSVMGREHAFAGRNNQDAFYLTATNDNTVAVVADGCGSGRFSECGAGLGVRLVTETLLKYAREISENQPLTIELAERMLERTRSDVLIELRSLAGNMGKSFSNTIENFFLFTLVGAWLSPNLSVFFALGDGVMEINGEQIILGPFPNNAPPYLAYGLAEVSKPLYFRAIKSLPTSELQHFIVATDGLNDYLQAAEKQIPGREEKVGSISRFYEDDKFFKNSDMVRRRLAIMNRSLVGGAGGLLPDDTTLIVGRQQKKETS